MSMFLDTAKIKVKAGNGGDGMVAFRREKYVPNGGPWGGDGGRGGNVIFVVDEGLRTLMDFRYNRHFKAQNGEKGMTKGMHGRGAEDLYVRVPKERPSEMLRLARSLQTWLKMDKSTLSHTVAVADVEIFVLPLQRIQLQRFLRMGNLVRNANSN